MGSCAWQTSGISHLNSLRCGQQRIHDLVKDGTISNMGDILSRHLAQHRSFWASKTPSMSSHLKHHWPTHRVYESTMKDHIILIIRVELGRFCQTSSSSSSSSALNDSVTWKFAGIQHNKKHLTDMADWTSFRVQDCFFRSSMFQLVQEFPAFSSIKPPFSRLFSRNVASFTHFPRHGTWGARIRHAWSTLIPDRFIDGWCDSHHMPIPIGTKKNFNPLKKQEHIADIGYGTI